VQTATDNHASYVVTNNFKTENYLVADDRRFSVPEITDIPLLDVFTEKVVNKFNRELEENPKIIANIGWWIIENGEKEELGVNIPWKRSKFFELITYSLREWQKFVVDKILSLEADQYNLVDLRFEFAETTGLSKFAGAGTMESFLSQYRDEEGKLLGEVRRSGNEHLIIPNRKYRKETELMDI